MDTNDIFSGELARRALADVPLARIDAEYIGAAKKALPKPNANAGPMSVDTIARGVGRVRLFFNIHVPDASLRRRGVNPIWVCNRAERLWSQNLASDGRQHRASIRR